MERVLQCRCKTFFILMETTEVKSKYKVSIDLLNDAVGKEIATSLQYIDRKSVV